MMLAAIEDVNIIILYYYYYYYYYYIFNDRYIYYLSLTYANKKIINIIYKYCI